MPLSYPSLQSVLVHMEANQRYLLAARCPSLRALHQSLPLSIQSIILTKTSVVVNNSKHFFRSFVAPKAGQELSKPMENRNLRGGCSFDLNEYGDAYEEHWGRPGNWNRTEYDIYITYYLQEFGGSKRSVRYPNGIKIMDAFEIFLQNFMGGSRVTFVGRLQCKDLWCPYLSPELKLNVQELRVDDNFNTYNLSSVEPILDPACLPIKKLCVGHWKTLSSDPSRHPFLRAPMHLEIGRYEGALVTSPQDEERRVALPWNIRSVLVCDKTISSVRLAEFVQHWSEIPRDVGTRFSFQRLDVADCLEWVRHRIGGTQATIPCRLCPKFPHCISLRIRAGLELNVYGIKNPNSVNWLEKKFGKPWMLVVEYMEEGAAVPVNN